jgi:hypothetical protein
VVSLSTRRGSRQCRAGSASVLSAEAVSGVAPTAREVQSVDVGPAVAWAVLIAPAWEATPTNITVGICTFRPYLTPVWARGALADAARTTSGPVRIPGHWCGGRRCKMTCSRRVGSPSWARAVVRLCPVGSYSDRWPAGTDRRIPCASIPTPANSPPHRPVGRAPKPKTSPTRAEASGNGRVSASTRGCWSDGHV